MEHAETWVRMEQDFLADPYPAYAALRETDPVHFDRARASWMVMRYRDIVAVVRDNERFSAEQGGPPSMLVADPPDHTRLRTLVSKAFTVRAVRQLIPRIEQIVEELLDTAAARGTIDAIAEFAYPLPIIVIAELLGVDPQRRDFFRNASQKIALSLGAVTDPRAATLAAEGRNELLEYFDAVIAQRRAEPRDDLVTAMIRAEDRGDMLNHRELVGMLLLLLVGGHETTVNLIGNGLLALLRNPDQLALLRSRTDVEERAIEELLRYDSPVQYSGRVAKVAVGIGGQRIQAGDRVRMIFASANRDPEVFDAPGQLDLLRDPCPHLSFGLGIHYCLGAELARLEGRIALSRIVRRFPKLRLTGDELRWRPAAVLRGLEALPVAF
jgi:cytochrome P450